MELRDSSDTVVAANTPFSRQATIRLGPPTDAGPYTLRVFSFPGNQSFPVGTGGPYLLDISAGTATVSISITTDGFTPFGSQDLGISVDTTSGGTNDVQTVQVTTGPVDLYIWSTQFTDDENTWSLGTTSGSDQVIWEFSPDGNPPWTTFITPNLLETLALDVAQASSQNIFFRLTMPSSSSSIKEHGVSVTLVAVEAGGTP